HVRADHVEAAVNERQPRHVAHQTAVDHPVVTQRREVHVDPDEPAGPADQGALPPLTVAHPHRQHAPAAPDVQPPRAGEYRPLQRGDVPVLRIEQPRRETRGQGPLETVESIAQASHSGIIERFADAVQRPSVIGTIRYYEAMSARKEAMAWLQEHLPTLDTTPGLLRCA